MLFLAFIACASQSAPDEAPAVAAAPPPPMVVTSDAFQESEAIPTVHSCEGSDTSPALSWTGVPDNAASLVLVVDDPDAPDPAAPQITWVHWVLYDIPASASALPAATEPGSLPSGTRQALNGWGRPGYGGPCPPIGRHRYFHKLYALDIALGDLGDEADKDAVLAAMEGHVLGMAALIGTYEKAPANP